MVTTAQVQQNDFSRVWMIPFGAGPNKTPSYESLARADIPTWDFGEPTPIWIPDPGRLGKFINAGKVAGDVSLPTMSIMWYYLVNQQSVLDRFAKSRCPHDIHLHMGECTNPQDFNAFAKVLIMEGALPTSWTTDNALGALSPDGRALITEELPFTADKLYHVYPMNYAQQAETEVVQEIVGITICDSVQCGSCGVPSNGYDKVFAITLTVGGSPGLSAEMIFTENSGDVWQDTPISTLAANQDPNDLACIGINMVVISEDSDSIHYAPLADILAGTEVWTEVTTGFVVGNGPQAIHSESPCLTWIVGENGYVYFTTDPTVGITEVQDAGVATSEDLNDIHAYDINNLVAVGDNNAVLVSRNGTTWSSILGPSVGVVLNTVWMSGKDEWFIGDAGGQLWYTVDAGVNWIEKLFPGSGAGVVRDIKFSSKNVGFMSHDTVAPLGRILRTIDGGNSWFVQPQNSLGFPANDRITALAVTEEEVNVVFGGGLEDDAVDGIIVKGIGPIGSAC